jgi:hypothetical protein
MSGPDGGADDLAAGDREIPPFEPVIRFALGPIYRDLKLATVNKQSLSSWQTSLSCFEFSPVQ